MTKRALVALIASILFPFACTGVQPIFQDSDPEPPSPIDAHSLDVELNRSEEALGFESERAPEDIIPEVAHIKIRYRKPRRLKRRLQIIDR